MKKIRILLFLAVLFSVFLELRVKVSQNWRNDPNVLKQFGYGKGK